MSNRLLISDLIGLAGWLVLSFIAAAIGAIASIEAGAFYQQLDRPGWAPPTWVFSPMWTALYLMMGIAVWLVWRERRIRHVVPALILFIVQLIANALWSWLFFAWRFGGPALIEILILLALITGTVVAFWRVRRLAALLMTPYWAWVAFASVLTWAVWQRNPGVL